MADTSEKLSVTLEKTSEIKTPEELYVRLEQKGEQALADRVKNTKKIVDSDVKGGSRLDWKQLRSELSDPEKQKIEDVLKVEDPEVGNRLKTVAEVAVGTTIVAGGVVGITAKDKKENTNKVKEWLKEGKQKRTFFKDHMLDAAKKANGGELDFGEKIMINIMAFIAPLIPEGMLGWLADFGILPEGMAKGFEEWGKGVRVFKDKVEGVKGKMEEKLPEAKKEVKEAGDITILSVAARGIVRFYPEEQRKNYTAEEQKNAPATLVNLKDMSYKAIREKYEQSKSDINKLPETFEMKSTKPKELDLAIKSLLFQHEHFILFFKRSPKYKDNWEDIPLVQLISLAGSEFALLTKMEAIQSADDAEAWLKNLVRPASAESLQNDEGFRSKFHAMQDRYSGLDTNLIVKILPLNAASINGDTFEKQGFSPEQQGFVKNKLVPFRENFLKSLDNPKNNFGIPGNELREVFAGDNGVFGMGDALNMFIRTGGHTDFSEMNAFEYGMYYQMIVAYLWKKDKKLAGRYLTKITEKGLSGDMPIEMQKMFSILGGALSTVIKNFITSTLGFSWGVFQELPLSAQAAVLAAGAVFFLLLRPLFIGKVAVLTTGLSTVALFGLAGSFTSNPADKTALENAQKTLTNSSH